jgi:transposase
MAARIIITVTETTEELKSHRASCADYLRPRIKMLQLIATGVTSVKALTAKTGISDTTIRIYKRKYLEAGLQALIREGRGGDKRSGLTAEQKQKIEAKLSDPKNGLRSYIEAQAWLKAELGIEKEYHAVNKYLKRNFVTKLKVGRKNHVKKDEAAVAVFKKPARGDQSH